MPHIMIDFETFGTQAGCVLRSIGAVVFDPYSDKLGNEFYANIDRASCEAAGLTVDPDTANWWLQQSEAAQQALLVDPRPLKSVAVDFHRWWAANQGREVWAQGSNFDPGLWEAACRAIGMAAPWKFWDTRDTRTAYDMAGFNTKTMPRAGTYHNALDDAKYQARCVQAAYALVRGKKEPA